MFRLCGLTLLASMLCACAGDLAGLQQDLTQTAQAQVRNRLAAYYGRELRAGVERVLSGLAAPRGYLDNPLVRILLPPPLGLAIGVVRELQQDPQAALLTALMNQAAEQAVPGAAPLLRSAIEQLTTTEARDLLEAGGHAGTEFLRARTAASLHQALAPLIGERLDASGAAHLYAGLRELHAVATADSGVPMSPAEPTGLEDYVTAQAVDGLFTLLAAEEQRVRRELDTSLHRMLPAIAPMVPPDAPP